MKLRNQTPIFPLASNSLHYYAKPDSQFPVLKENGPHSPHPSRLISLPSTRLLCPLSPRTPDFPTLTVWPSMFCAVSMWQAIASVSSRTTFCSRRRSNIAICCCLDRRRVEERCYRCWRCLYRTFLLLQRGGVRGKHHGRTADGDPWRVFWNSCFGGRGCVYFFRGKRGKRRVLKGPRSPPTIN